MSKMSLSTARSAVGNIVGRCHVGDSFQDVEDYVRSRLTPKGWDEHKAILPRAIRAEHTANREVYCRVMGGRLGGHLG